MQIVIEVKVVPGAARNEIVGWEGERLRIRIAAPPEKGKANMALVRFLAKQLHISRSSIEIVGGESGRYKRLRIEGLELEEIRRRV